MNTASSAPHGCDHIGILTNNAHTLITFYTEKLDFQREREEVLPRSIFEQIFGFATDCRFVRLSAGDFALELFEPLRAQARTRTAEVTGLNHFGYCVQNKQDYVDRLREKNVDIIEVKRSSHTVYFVCDPDGNRIEIREYVA
jgi:catechol 2,3-dioxygenase-like lactoylglutathione lyase family enzyme